MELDYIALGQRLRHIRKSRGMTQTFLAEQVGIEPSNISHIERAVSKVGLGTMANVLGCSVDDLLCDSLQVEREAFENQLVELSKDCSPMELRLLTDLASAMKNSLRNRGFEK